MGIGGHMLGAKKLKQLSTRSTLPLNRACHRNGYCEGVVWTEESCIHYSIDFKTGEHVIIENPMHWYTCHPKNRSV
jgi:hypothetical protein